MAAADTTFDLLHQPISPGRKLLLEAGAGTGKTFNLANLYLRLVLEGENCPGEQDGWPRLSVGNILVVTYTRLATAELVDRIRRLLTEALDLLESGTWAKDEFPGMVLEQFVTSGDLLDREPRLQLAKLRLRLALAEFDQAAVMTIHGFCSRMLDEFAFESGDTLNVELVDNDDDLLAEAVAGFVRRYFYRPADPLPVYLAWHAGLTFAALTALARQVLNSPELTLDEEDAEATPATGETSLQARVDAFRSAWTESIAAELNALVYKAADRTPPDWLPQLRRLASGADFGGMFDVMAAFTRENFTEAINKTKCRRPVFSPALAALLAAGDEVAALTPSVLAKWRRRFLDYLRTGAALKERKAVLQVRSYNDLLLDLREALRRPSGDRLAELIRGRFKAVMIDEFQDTDPLQYEIFTRLFDHPECLLVMVGDPKQSIYSFRGADIYSYLAVKSGLERGETPTLTRNFRSVPRLIEAVNRLFDTPYAFAESSISFLPAVAGGTPRTLVIDGEPTDRQPLQIDFYEDDLNSDGAMKLLCRKTAEQIAGLLALARQGRAVFRDSDGAETPLRPTDLAVLVNRHDQAYRLKRELSARGVNSVTQCSRNVFESDDARSFFLVIHAIANPSNLRAVRSALLTPLLLVPAADLCRFQEAETAPAALDFWLDSFNNLHRCWERDGFMPMFRRFLRLTYELDDGRRRDVRSNLAGLVDGERRLTNILHLAELTHGAIREYRFGLTATLEWLRQNINDPTAPSDGDSREQRLESDEEAVRILTVFKSKGLQFPVVFCPFAWQPPFLRRDTDHLVVAHTDDGHGNWHRRLAGSGDNPVFRRQYRRELLSEDLRLFYVALTRAVNCCYLALGDFKVARDAAPTYLQSRDWTDEKLADFLDAGRDDLLPSVSALQSIWGDSASAAARVVSHPAEATPDLATSGLPPEAVPVLTPPQLPEAWHIPRDAGVMSFTVLTAGEHTAAESNPDLDDPADAPEAAAEPLPGPAEGLAPFAAFPRGKVAGDCLHRILERLDFAAVRQSRWAARPEMVKLLEDHLRLFGRTRSGAEDADRLAQLAAMLEQVLAVPLPGPAAGLRLCDLAAADHLPETGFFFRVRQNIDLTALERAVRQSGLADYRAQFGTLLDRLPLTFGRHGPRQGYMTGKIDLFFRHGGKYYLADWKSNYLGDRYYDYRPERLLENMFSSSYVLQYLIYTLAADKYLCRVLPGYDYDTHFGGVYYIYLRGANREDNRTGIFYDRPDRALLTELYRIFPDGEATHEQ